MQLSKANQIRRGQVQKLADSGNLVIVSVIRDDGTEATELAGQVLKVASFKHGGNIYPADMETGDAFRDTDGTIKFYTSKSVYTLKVR